MIKNKNLILEETFELATKNHKENNIKLATDFYNQVLEIDPKHAPAHNNLGGIFVNSQE